MKMLHKRNHPLMAISSLLKSQYEIFNILRLVLEPNNFKECKIKLTTTVPSSVL